MNVENHPLLREHPELAEKLLTKAMADGAFAQRAQRFAALDVKIREAAAEAAEVNEHTELGRKLVDELQKPVASSCCGGCGGSGH